MDKATETSGFKNSTAGNAKSSGNPAPTILAPIFTSLPAPKEPNPAERQKASFTFESLRQFVPLAPSSITIPVPLPAVSPHAGAQNRIHIEERDSAAHCGEFPYHPSGWTGKLPGPSSMVTPNPTVRDAELNA